MAANAASASSSSTGRHSSCARVGALCPSVLRRLKLLTLLLARPGELASREDLQRALWDGDTFVDFEQGVNHAIRELRAALGDDAESPRFIQTLPRRGYRFIAPVERITPATSVGGSTGQRERRWKWLTAGTVATVLVGIAIAYLARGSGEARRLSLPMALSVRPFSAPADPALGIGLANAISARLGGQQAVSVRSATTGANYVLDGEVVIAGTDVSVLARLQDGTSGATVWSDRVGVRADQLFSVEAVITERVVEALRLRLAATEQDRLRRRYTSNSAAYSEYLRGRAALVKYTRRAPRAPSRPSRGRCGRIPVTRSHGPGWRWRAPTCTCASRGRAKSSGGESERRRRRAPRWRSIRIWRKPTSPGRRWLASASSIGTRRSRPGAGRSC